MGEMMKKLKTIFAIMFCMLASSVLGACSCSKIEITVTKMTLSANELNDVIVGEEFFVEFTLSPNKSSNTKVFVDVIEGKGVVNILNNDYIVNRTFNEKVYFKAIAEGNAVVQFKSESGNVVQHCQITVNPEPQVLATPQISFDSNTGLVNWTAVSSNQPNKLIEGYALVVNETEIPVDKNITQYDVKTIYSLDGSYDIKVKALGQKAVDADSEFSNTIKLYVLDTPQNVTINNGKITWNAVLNPLPDGVAETSLNITYNVSVDNGVTFENTANLCEYNFSAKGLSTYKLTVNAVPSSDFELGVLDESTGVVTYVYKSGSSQVKTVNTLSAPQNFKLVSTDVDVKGTALNSYFKWDAVTGTNRFDVFIKKGDKVYEFKNYTQTIFKPEENLTEEQYTAGEYEMYVVAVGNPETQVYGENTTKTQVINFKKLPALTSNVDYEANTLTISLQPLFAMGFSDEDASKLAYELYFRTNTGESVFYKHYSTSNVVDLTSIPNLNGGTYNCYVRPVYNSISVGDTEIANCVMDINTMSAEVVIKLEDSIISAISNEGVVAFNAVSNASHFKVQITEDGASLVNTTLSGSAITITQTGYSFSLNDVYALTNFSSGKTYRIIVSPTSNAAVDAIATDDMWFTFTKANNVSNITVTTNQANNNVITWQTVNNFGYVVKFNNAVSDTLSTNQYTPTTSNINNSNLVTVYTLGNNQNILNSDGESKTLTKLSALTSVNNANGTFNWVNDNDCTFLVKYYNNLEGTLVIKTQIVSASELTQLDGLEENYISIAKIKEGYFNSSSSAIMCLKQLAQVKSITIKSVNNTNVITWEAIENADKYAVSYYLQSQGADAAQTLEVSSETATLPLGAGVYAINITALKTGNGPFDISGSQTYLLNANPSAVAVVEMLAQPTVAVKNGAIEISVSAVATVDCFSASINYAGFENLVITAKKQANKYVGTYELEDLPKGSYQITVAAKGVVGENTIHSASTTFEPLEKVGAVSVFAQAGELKFNEVQNASDYEIYMLSGENYTPVSKSNYELSLKSGVYTLRFKTATTGVFKVRAIATSGMLNSQLSAEYTFEQLATPTNFKKVGNVFSWTGVENNAGYMISCGSDIYTASTTTYNVPALTEIGAYNFNLMALGNTATSGTYYTNSNKTSCEVVILNSPRGISLTGSTLSWANYLPASTSSIDSPLAVQIIFYELLSDQSLSPVCEAINLGATVTQHEFGNMTELQNGKTYKISVKYVGNGNDVMDSAEIFYSVNGDAGLVERVATPELYIISGELFFNDVESATNYKLYNTTSGTPVEMNSAEYTITNTEGVNKITLNSSYNEKRKIAVIAETNLTSTLSSFISADIIVEKLGNTSVSILNGVISWEEVENAQKYELLNTTNSVALQYNDTNVDISLLGLDLSNVSSYSFVARALGSQNMHSGVEQTDGSMVYYLNGDYCTRNATILLVTSIDTLTLSNGVIRWKNIEGVESYKLTITITGKEGELVKFERIESVYSEETTFNFDREIEIGNYSSDTLINIIVQPYYVLDNSYYIVTDGVEQKSINIYKPAVISKPYVQKGLFGWNVGLSRLTDTEISELKIIYDRALNNTLTTSDNLLFEKYKRYISFNLQVNDSEIKDYISPIYLIDETTKTAYYCYNNQDVLASNRSYTFKVAVSGNTSSEAVYDESGEVVITPAVSGILPGNYSATMTATKYAVAKNTYTKGGDIYFTKVPNMDEAQYLLVAVPSAEDHAVRQVTLTPSSTGTTGLVIKSNNDQGVIYDVFDLFTGTNALAYNITYTYQLYLAGSEYSTSDSALLMSTMYNTVKINFLNSIVNFTYSTTRGDTEGGVLEWSQNLGIREQKLYLLNSNIYETLSASDQQKDWINNENTIVIDLPSDTNYFAFNSELGQRINAGAYHTAIAYNSDSEDKVSSGLEVSFVASKTLSNIVPIVKLSSITQDTLGSWLKNGRFAWKHDNANGISNYKVVFFWIDKSGNKTESQNAVLYSGTRTTLELPTNYSSDDLAYGMQVTPLGTQYGGVNYVAGNPVDTTAYYRLKQINPYFEIMGNEQLVRWEYNNNADSYTLNVNEMQDEQISSSVVDDTTNIAYYDISDYLTGGIYSIKVKANSNNSVYLTGVYSNKAIMVTKMFAPEIRVKDGVIVWDRTQNAGVETLVPLKTKATIVKANPNTGEPLAGAETKTIYINYDNENIEDIFKLELDDKYEEGCYLVGVNFENVSLEDSEYIIGSDVSTLLVKKFNSVVIEQGIYRNEDDSLQNECKFDNYVKWQGIPNASDYKVRFMAVDAENNENPIEYGKEYYTVKNDASMFDSKTDEAGNTIFYFNIFNMVAYSKNKVKIYVTALGNTVAYQSAQQAYVNSNESSITIDNPANVIPANINAIPDKGIITWDAEGINCKVEAIITGGTIRKTVITDSNVSYTTEIITEENPFVISGINSLDEIFYIPFVGNNFSVQLRYYTSNFVSDTTNTVQVHNNMFYSGRGVTDSAETPFVIYSTNNDTLSQMFTNIVYSPNSNFILYSDIDMTGVDFVNDSTVFTGTLDGNNKVVSNLKFSKGTYMTMFTEVATGAIVKNITLNYAPLQTDSQFNKIQYAGIAFENNGTIQNITLTGSIEFSNCTNGFKGGGVVLNNQGTITDIQLGTSETAFIANITQDISGDTNFGGVANTNSGLIESVRLVNAKIDIANENDTAYLGGIAYQNSGSIEFCNVLANSEINSNNLGGIVYENNNNAKVIGCGFIGIINANATTSRINVGGLVGYNKGTLKVSYASLANVNQFVISSVSGSCVGGLVGLNGASTSEINGCYVVNYLTNATGNYGVAIGSTNSDNISSVISVCTQDTSVGAIGNRNGLNISGIQQLSSDVLARYERDENGNILKNDDQPVFTHLNTLNNDATTNYKFVFNGDVQFPDDLSGNLIISNYSSNIPFVVTKKDTTE